MLAAFFSLLGSYRVSVYTLKRSFEDSGVMIVTHVLFKAFSRAFVSMGCSPLKINLP